MKKSNARNPELPASQKVVKLLLLKNWLLSGKKITSRQSSKMWGYDRAADGIWKLRNPPHNLNIETVLMKGQDRYLNDVEYAVYKWLGEVPVIKYRSLSPGEAKLYTFTHRYPMKAGVVKKHILKYLERVNALDVKKIGFLKKNILADRRVSVETSFDVRVFKIIQLKADNKK